MTPRLKLIELINSTNGTSVPPEALTLGPPAVWDTGDVFRNTSVLVSGVVEEGYSADYVFYYRRIDLERLFQTLTVSVELSDTAVTQDVIDLLNAQFPALGLMTEDFVHEAIDRSATEYVLTPLVDSYTFIGAIEVQITRDTFDISRELVVTQLSGFTMQTVDISTQLTQTTLSGFSYGH